MILILTIVLFTNKPYTIAQTANVIDIPIFFHPNSLLINDVNDSFRLYEGANGMTPIGSGATLATLTSQIYGQQTVFGIPIEYWSAIIIWAMRVPKDIHVSGTVNVRAYISSNFEISGFTSGSGYSMGIVDIDENNNTVQAFLTDAPNTIGDNIFTPTPQQYSIDTDVDYVFKAGHALGFVVGFGATTQGYTALVYFSSTDKPSGATLPIEDTTETYEYTADSQTIKIQSNSAIADFNYDSTQKTIQFTAKLIDFTLGHCDITIPKTLMHSPFTITSDSKQITPTMTETQTSYQIYFTHTRDSNPIQVTGKALDTPTPTPTPQETQAPTPAPSPTPTSTTTPTPNETDTVNPTDEPIQAIPELPAIVIIVVAITAAITIFLILYKKKQARK